MVGIPFGEWVLVDRTMYFSKMFFRQIVLSRGRSSVGRAPALQAGGRRFETVRLHQVATKTLRAHSSVG